jgi:hypothetical protein
MLREAGREAGLIFLELKGSEVNRGKILSTPAGIAGVTTPDYERPLTGHRKCSNVPEFIGLR